MDTSGRFYITQNSKYTELRLNAEPTFRAYWGLTCLLSLGLFDRAYGVLYVRTGKALATTAATVYTEYRVNSRVSICPLYKSTDTLRYTVQNMDLSVDLYLISSKTSLALLTQTHSRPMPIRRLACF